MNIVKWLSGHPIIAIWTLGVIAILLAMGSGSNTQHIKEKQNHSISEKAVNTTDIEAKSASNERAANASVEINDEQNEKNEPEEKITQSNSVQVAPEAEQINTPEIKNKMEPFTRSANDETEKNKSPAKAARLIPEDLGQLGTDELLLMAREAYWNNGLDEAAQIYQQLIIREPQIIEHKGELGNVYWRQGYPKKAAELYSEIAIPLIESGASDRVTNMLGFIQLFYPERVDVIMDRLDRYNNSNKKEAK